jgi:hypothetical protein
MVLFERATLAYPITGDLIVQRDLNHFTKDKNNRIGSWAVLG